MRIGIVTAWGDCGAGYVSKAYASLLSGSCEVFILARGGGGRGDPFWSGPTVDWALPHSSLTGVHRSDLLRWIRQRRLDAIIFNEQRHWEAVLAARSSGVLVGAYVDYYREDTVALFRLYDFLVCNTQRHYSVFSWHPQCTYLPWGTDCVTFRPQSPAQQRPITFFHSGGWSGPNDRKGTGLALRAFTHVRGDVRLVIHTQVPLDRRAQDWAGIIAADGRIVVKTGTVKPPCLYHLGDVYVYPCRLDGIGLSVPEALACGLPVIAPNWAPWNEFVTAEAGTLLDVSSITGRQDGYYWPEVRVTEESVTRAMQRYADNPTLVREQSPEARLLAERSLDWSKNARTLGDWIARCRRLESPDSLRRLANKADVEMNPTILRTWIQANRRVVGRLAAPVSRHLARLSGTAHGLLRRGH
jgi:glycosyltransferase involved in cell wall biosynthesis